MRKILTVNLQVPLVLHDGVVQGHVFGAAGQVAAVVLDRGREPQHALRHAAVARLKEIEGDNLYNSGERQTARPCSPRRSPVGLGQL